MKRRLAQILRNLTIQERLLLLLLTISFLSSGLYMYFGYVINSNALINGIDKRLLLFATTVNQLLPERFYETVGKTPPETPKEIFSRPPDDPLRRAFEQVRELEKNAGLAELYTVMRTEDGTYWFPFGCTVGYNIVYDDPAPEIVETLATGKTVATTISDPEYGTNRGVLIRGRTADGQYYVLGAEVSLEEVQESKEQAFYTFFWISTLSFFTLALVGCVLARRLSRPLRQLSNFTVSLRKADFNESVTMPPQMLPPPGTENIRNEIDNLAGNIDLMQKELLHHIETLKTTMQQKERAESELRIAGSIQLNFLPHILNDAHADVKGSLTPAFEAGGDLYDFRMLDRNHLFFAVGDVCGKGMPAALFMAMTLTLLRASIRTEKAMNKVVKAVNDHLAESNDNCTFVTLLCGILELNTGVLEYCNAGNCPPLIRRNTGKCYFLPVANDPPVGALEGIDFSLRQETLAIGDAMLLYTDGITEAMAADKTFYGEKRFLEAAQKIKGHPDSRRISEELLADVKSFIGDVAQSDDITLVVIQRRGSACAPDTP